MSFSEGYVRSVRRHAWWLVFLLAAWVGTGCAPEAASDDEAAGQDAPEAQAPAGDGIDPEARLVEMGIDLPTPPPPVANYVRAVRTGNLVFLSGHGPLQADGAYMTGKVGADLTVEQGYEAARLTGIALLASLKENVGDLNRVRRIVKVTGMVNATPDFTEQPQVVNGCSDLMVEVFGEARGKHARSAVGMSSLPIGIPVEIELVAEVDPE